MRWFGVVGTVGAMSLFLFLLIPPKTVDVKESSVPQAMDTVVYDSYEEFSIEALSRMDVVGGGFSMGELLTRNSFYSTYAFTYNVGTLSESGVVYIPISAVVHALPTVISAHGYIMPSVYTSGRGLKREEDFLARSGFVVFHPDYRNHAYSDVDPENDVKLRVGYVIDILGLVAALKEADLSYVDIDRLGFLGHSMGGGVGWEVAVVAPGAFDALVFYAPISADAWDNFSEFLSKWGDVAVAILERYGSPQERPEFWHDISPVNYLDRVSAPIQVHHGTGDEEVPVSWSKKNVAALEAAGKTVSYYEYAGAPHEFLPPEWGVFIRRVRDFFNANLK